VDSVLGAMTGLKVPGFGDAALGERLNVLPELRRSLNDLSESVSRAGYFIGAGELFLLYAVYHQRPFSTEPFAK
jgi:hypothetical protein